MRKHLLAVPAGMALLSPVAIAATDSATTEPGAPPPPPLLGPAGLLPAPPATPATPPRPRRAQRRFPVRGEVSYGEAAARYGDDRGSHIHAGQDVFAPAGTPLVAVESGVVVEAGTDGGRGNHVAIYAPRSRRTYVYFHLQAPAIVEQGRRVRAGRRVGRVGCTGRCFGDHLHFEVHRGRGATGRTIDPLPLLRRLRRAAG